MTDAAIEKATPPTHSNTQQHHQHTTNTPQQNQLSSLM